MTEGQRNPSSGGITGPGPRDRTELVAWLRETIDAVLDPLLRKEPVALVDFPRHRNAGDHAIWLGVTTYLRAADIPVDYVTDRDVRSLSRLKRRFGRGTVLINGGGNFGDLWPEAQRFRERLVFELPRATIVQLPQSIEFRSTAALEQAQATFERHPDLTLLLRDRRSLALAREHFSARSLLCPDMAFAIGTLERPIEPVRDVTLVARTDAESAGHLVGLPLDLEPTDWIEWKGYAGLIAGITWRARFRAARLMSEFSVAPRIAQRRYDALARSRMLPGLKLLSTGRTVITDRLHGHILSLLLGIPHVVLDNSYGKVKGVYDAWTQSAALAQWADSLPEALDLARQLQREARPSPHA